MNAKNITRYTYERTAFQGWRLSICRRQRQFTRYFSDRAYGSEEKAFEAARSMRDTILAELAEHPENAGAIFESHR